MIYTIGHTESYEQYFREQIAAAPQKAIGGSVWLTREQAQARCPALYSVYGVKADWKTQTVPSQVQGADWNILTVNAELVKT